MGIRVNQIGFITEAKKQFIYVGEGRHFQVVDEKDHCVVFEGELSESIEDQASGEITRKGDFSRLRQEGIFRIEVEKEQSLTFPITKKGYKEALHASLKAFYYQRCGVEVEEVYANEWKHAACHLQKSYLYHPQAEELLQSDQESLVEIDTKGGWHDAGDYGRYTVAAAKAIADLLYAYLHFPMAFQESIGIPESIYPGADLLHEVKVELDWMLKMQREDGAVYTKVATRFFPGMIMPEEDLDPLFIFDVSTPATADFAAALALAAKVYQEKDSSYAQRCLSAAIAAYQWVKQQPQQLFTNPENINSGEYGDTTDVDERYWAAAQLFEITGESTYHEDFLYYAKELKDRLSLGWADVGGYGTLCYLTSTRERDSLIYEELKADWLNYAQLLEKRSQEDGYGISLSIDEYIWGSNMVLLNQAMVLIIANLLGKDTKFDDLIYSDVDYLFGKNPMDISYITGFGSKAVSQPHHRPCVADGVEAPVPGLVSGGPCQGLYDEAVQKTCTDQPPAKCFVDHADSYSTNEITIYWNSPFVYVLAYLNTKE